MNKYNDLSVKVKIPILLGSASIAVFTLICVLLVIPLRNTTLSTSATEAKLTAEVAGERLAVSINASASIMPARASGIASLTESELVPAKVKRQTLMNELETLVLSDGTAVNNVWIIMEPNALDGLDSLYRNHTGSTDKGILSARLNSIGRVSCADYDVNNILYRQVKQNRQSIMSQPYQDELNGKTVWIITAISPIVHLGNFDGVVATDYNLEELCAMVSSYNTIGEGKLVTDKGYIAAYSDYSRVGALAENGNREILDLIETGKPFEGFFNIEGEESFKVYVPIQLGTSAKPWFYAVDVSPSRIYENARKVTNLLIIYCVFGVILIAIFGYFMLRPMLHSVITVTDIIRQLSLGRINLQISKNQSKDELGMMNSELNKLLDGLKNTAGFARDIGEGDLNAEYQLLSDDDALGNSLLEMRKSLQKAEMEQTLRAKEEEQRNWGTAGLAKFAEILRRDNNDLEALSYNVISNMVKYLGINQGGMFVVNETEHDDERVLEMKACYAFDRKKFVDKQIRPGEGLVGTCFLEGEPIYMTEIPNEYITITSGLGDANPKALLICPLKVNDQIFGVIELASFQPFEAYQLDFVQKVSESIAATISSVNVNIRTNQLLEQTKMQAEEMVNTEEELRQNMEEMQATQEESRRRESDLQETLERMKEVQTAGEEKEYEMQQFYCSVFDTFNMVDISAEGVITDVNQNLLNIFKSDKSVFMGKPMTTFIGAEAFHRAWSELTQGRYYEESLSVDSGDGKILTLKHKFMPMCNKHGELKRVLLFAIPEKS